MNFIIREDFLILFSLFIFVLFLIKILVTFILLFIEVKERKMNKRVECYLIEKKIK